ncbi:NAD(P)H-dependent oxidoreductase [Lacimicrobium sp. SS2-24]|uniref:NAD(P)H-dependent oxidoreductase n=1 Tax=Lacimicrobium sp. SS2-24 TaxID=2005569 RepID=UPI000B4BC227|nr:NAD(P)H-dependent oxidoreductase [Lacimicrobium sp. SS2-24]
MSNILIINAHQHYPFSEGRLNKTLTEKAEKQLQLMGHQVTVVTMTPELDVEAQLELHQWADVIILQSPVNWMGVPWLFKKYMDEVYTAGMGGALCHGDGRSEAQPKKNYGRGGTMTGKKYMLSLTANAPAEAFNDTTEFFEGKSVDDLMFPMHMNFKFFGMQPLPTFICHDVMKNAQAEADLVRYEKHLKALFQESE